MKRRMGCPQGWVPLRDAASVMGLFPESLRHQIQKGHFTGLRRTNSRNTALYLPQAEVDAFLVGGIDAVTAMRAAKAKPGRPVRKAGAK